MAKGRKTGGRNWIPGQSGNPEGPKPLPKDVKEARSMTRLEFERIANRFLSMTREEIQTKLKDPTTTALELMIGSIIVKSVQGGDQRRLDFVLDRTIGKVLTPIGLAGHDGGPLDPYLNMSSEERARLRAEYEKRLGPVKLEKPVK